MLLTPDIQLKRFVTAFFQKHANSEIQKFFAAVNHLNGPLRKQNFT